MSTGTQETPLPKFWNPEFEYEHRFDGTIVVRQKGELPEYLPTIAAYLDYWADTAPDRPFLARREMGGDWRKITYSETRNAARSIGATLIGHGLGPDRPLLILSQNSLEHALLGLGALYVGVPYAPVSPAYSLVSTDHGKLRDIASKLDPGMIFADDGEAFAPALAAIAAPDRLEAVACNGGKGSVAFSDLLSAPSETTEVRRTELTPDTVVKYLFTSGSTGSPKAVINTNRMICSNQAMVRDCFRFLEDRPPVVLDWAPWNHTASGNKVFYMVLTNGGTYYIDDGRPVAGKFDETLRNLREVSPTWYFNVPVGWDFLCEELERDSALAERFFANLDMMFYAGAGMAQRTWNRLMATGRKVAGREVLLATALGATETAPFALACTDVQERAGNVGVPSKGLALKLVPVDGKLEARLKGPNITPGYYGDPKTTAESFDDEGFYKLGDALRPADPNDFSKGFFFDGRIAENFKLSTGTWVTVGAVRAGLVDSFGGLLHDAVIVGENQPQLGALLILSAEALAMNEHALQVALTEHLSAAARAATGSAARVRRAIVLQHSPSFDRGEVTEKGSLNQRAMRSNNEELIALLYAGGKGVIAV